ncbi:MAG: cytochrome c [Rhodocyclaceae bacterium]|nr:cytochrome c [Rhodocyclaceae bacterium]
MKVRRVSFLVAVLYINGAGAETVAPISAQALTRLVRQDCGSCHGMKLTGGLGTPLTREALAGRSPESLTATILYGRPGTTMPAWKSLISQAQAEWISARLLEGFPEESH